MAAGEARAAWQRVANRYLVQEDAKRAPKLACSQSSMLQHDSSNENISDCQDHSIAGFLPLNWNPSNANNLPPDTKWWLQSEPNFCHQKSFTYGQLKFLESEADVKKTEPLQPISENCEDSLLDQLAANEKCDPILEHTWMVSALSGKHGSDVGHGDLKLLTAYPQEPVKHKAIADFCHDQALFDQPSSKNASKTTEMDISWEEGTKSKPWWQTASDDELASFIAQRASDHIENCDLPRPTQTINDCRAAFSIPDDMDNHGLFLAHSKMLYPGIGDPVLDHSCTPSQRAEGLKWHQDGSETACKNDNTGSALSRRCNNIGGCHTSYNDAEESKQQGRRSDPPNAQLLEALRHSQTRAREAEMATRKAYDEKDDIVKLLFKQASHLFACKQWLKILQLENLCLQLKIKEQQIATMLPDIPWASPWDKSADGKERESQPQGRKGTKEKNSGICNAVMFAVGLGLASAGLLLGWTFGWLLPKM